MPEGYNVEGDADFAYRVNKHFFTELSLYAKDLGVLVCIENMPYKKNRLSSVPEIMKLVDDISASNFGVCLDTGHANIFGDNIGEDVRLIGDKLFALHIHDNTGWADAHRFPYCGTIDWTEFKNAISDIGFDGCLSLETFFSRKTPSDIKETLHKALFDILKTLL